MINQDDAEVGGTVYLRPTTKQAPRECYLRLAAVIVSYVGWPMVTVRVFDVPNDGYGREITVHRDNIGIRRKTKEKTQGDGQNAGEVGKSNIRPFARPVKPIDPESGYEEPVLF